MGFSDGVKAVARDFSPEEVSSAFATKVMTIFRRGLKSTELVQNGLLSKLHDLDKVLVRLLEYRENTQGSPTRLRSVTFPEVDYESEKEVGRIMQSGRAYPYQPAKAGPRTPI